MSVTTIGPRSAKPIANAALRVSVKTPFAAISCLRGTSCGIIAASAGPKNTVIVDTTTLSTRISRAGSRPTRNSPTNASDRSTFVTIRTTRLSSRSTYTPAMAENRTAGPRKVRIRMLTAVLDRVASRMMTVRP